MVWFRVDDGLPSSVKVLSIPRSRRLSAMGLWTLTGAWSAGELTDGRIPAFMVEEYGGTMKDADQLVRVGLWHTADTECESEDCQGIGPDEYVYHDWRDFQPSRAEVMAQRTSLSEKRAAAGRKGAATRWQRDGNPDGKPMATEKQTHGPSPVPSPVPVPVDQDTHSHRPSHMPPGSTDDPSQPVDKYQKALANTAARLSKEAGEEVSLLQAGVVVDHILGKANGEVKDPARYVSRSISGNVIGWTRFIHTGTLPVD